MITVTNITDKSTHKGLQIYCGRPSVLQNPFPMTKDSDREDVIRKYKKYFNRMIEDKDSKITNELNRLVSLSYDQDIGLLCHCSPLPCHCDIIKEELEEMIDNGEMVMKTCNDKIYNITRSMGYSHIQSHVIGQQYEGNNLKQFLGKERPNDNYRSLIDLNKGSDVFLTAVQSNVHIIFVVDYDADGISCGAIGKVFMDKYLGYTNYTIINNDREFGNGVNNESVKRILKLKNRHKDILITVGDQGSSDEERYKVLKENDIKIVVTDHHLVPSSGNPISVDAFINPQRDGGNFNTKISGCTVLYYLLLETYKKLIREDYPVVTRDDDLSFILPYVAVTIITDQMDLQDPLNRYLYNKGVSLLLKEENTLWSVLINKLGIRKYFSSTSIGFTIGPLLNAPGRMGNAMLATKAISENNNLEMLKGVDSLIKLNNSRKAYQNEIMVRAKKQAKIFTNSYKHSMVVVLNGGQGVGGIIASSIGERFKRPIFVFSKVGDLLHGSARGIVKGFPVNLVIEKFRVEHPEYFMKGGGHSGAAGCVIKHKGYKAFLEVFDKFAKDNIKENNKVHLYNMHLELYELDIKLLESLNKLNPFGMGFSQPLFRTSGNVVSLLPLGKDKLHYKVKLMTTSGIYGDVVKEFMFFNVEKGFTKTNTGDDVYITFTMGSNNFRGNVSMQLIGSEIRKV